jgi:basic membrane protein A
VDVDQAYIGSQVMTSALKKIDQAVLATVKQVQDGSYKAGDTTFDITNNGVGIGKTNSVGAKYSSKVQAVQDKIKSGAISDIPDTVK